ncbi:hypothetical protein NQF86_03370 [Bombella sp. TMW 2.2543]|uniref:Glucosamine inositolphosphorylceramide transferase 1 N-terminal domain-containing protein n=1 Tax=Bombella pluederhausensis TaxID=2967336 RepID=A0ABT3WJA4_9PROT|nr:hypothetical protein [Bombella pluederhausensis]MCX5617713.1 hypothetical protein [Bombella pluederhausensis]
MKLFTMDYWRSAILHAPFEQIIRQNSLDDIDMTFLPSCGKEGFLADPFGLWRDGKLYVFAEYYDYSQKKGVIEVLIYDEQFSLQERRRVLSEDWHLSYPHVFQHEGSVYMLPEAYKSGRLTLYKATSFPYEWQPVPSFRFPIGAIDATPLHHAGRWWLFWTPPAPKESRQSTLHIALAEELTGPWCDMGRFLIDRSGARPGGTPFVDGDEVFLPVQDCSTTYGGGIRLLRMNGFSRGRPSICGGDSIPLHVPEMKAYPDGIHTLSAAGNVTLVDFKKIRRGLGPALMNIKAHIQS